jgi:glyoxylase-like metal-dependent hydrolase (beta-lactamase superfamily II)
MRLVEPDALVRFLQRHGLTPDDVDDVVVTPLQAYAIGGLGLFRRATICVSRRGWLDIVAPAFYDERRYMAIPDPILDYLVCEVQPTNRLKLLDDEDEVCPGVHTWWAGTHHRGSVAINLATARGTVTVTDTVFYYENLEQQRWLGINESLEECRQTYQRLSRSDVVISIYDPKTLTRFPEGRVAVAPDRERSGH